MRRGKGVYRLFFIWAVLVVLFVFAAGVSGFGNFSGSWESDVFLRPQTGSLNFKPKIQLNYFSEGINYRSTTLFDEGSLYAQKFRTDFLLGPLAVRSTLDFDPEVKRLNYFLTETGMILAGLDIGNTFFPPGFRRIRMRIPTRPEFSWRLRFPSWQRILARSPRLGTEIPAT